MFIASLVDELKLRLLRLGDMEPKPWDELLRDSKVGLGQYTGCGVRQLPALIIATSQPL